MRNLIPISLLIASLSCILLGGNAYANNIKSFDKVLHSIEDLEKKIEQYEKKQSQIYRKINAYKRNITKNTRQTNKLNNLITENQVRLSIQLRQLQRLHNQSLLKRIASPNAYNQTKYHIQLIKQLPRLHVNTIAALKLLQAENKEVNERLHHTLKKLENERKKLKKVENQLLAKQKNRKKEITKKKALLKDVKIANYSQKKSTQQLLQKLKNTNVKNLSSLKNFRTYKGKLGWPAKGNIHTFKKNRNYSWEITNTQPLPVRAIAPGKVEYIGRLGILGKVIIINHGDNYRSIYKHLSSIKINQGQTVQSHQIISESGKTGGKEQYGISFELRHGRKSINYNRWIDNALL